jgi:hypothetical protein
VKKIVTIFHICRPLASKLMDLVDVGVAFWKRLPKDATRGKSFFERMIQKNQSIWHTETAFPAELLDPSHPIRSKLSGKDYVVAYGIFSKKRDGSIGTVFETPREFSADNYTWKWLQVPRSKAIAAMRFAQSQIGKPYDPWGQFKVIFKPDSVHKNTDKWICSTLTASILSQLTNTMRGVNPGAVSMDDIYDLLDNEIELTNKFSPKQRSNILKSGNIYSTYAPV